MEKVRAAVIGCGLVSHFHLEALLACPLTEPAGVFDADPGRAGAAAERYGLRAYGSQAELWADRDLDAVCICVPSGLHFRYALAALEAGKHVLVEKPMALTLADCDRLMEAAARRDLRLGVVSQLRFSPDVQRTKRALEAGALGKLVSADLYMNYARDQAYYDSVGWRGTRAMDGGGALMNQGIHGVDLLQYLAGPVESVFARSATLARRIEVEDTLCAVTRFRSGALGVIRAATSLRRGFPRRPELLGDAGAIILEEDTVTYWMTAGDEQPRTAGDRAVCTGSSDPSGISSEGHRRQIANFAAAILGREPLLVGGPQGRQALSLVLAAYRSAETGLPVEV